MSNVCATEVVARSVEAKSDLNEDTFWKAVWAIETCRAKRKLTWENIIREQLKRERKVRNEGPAYN